MAKKIQFSRDTVTINYHGGAPWGDPSSTLRSTWRFYVLRTGHEQRIHGFRLYRYDAKGAGVSWTVSW